MPDDPTLTLIHRQLETLDRKQDETLAVLHRTREDAAKANALLEAHIDSDDRRFAATDRRIDNAHARIDNERQDNMTNRRAAGLVGIASAISAGAAAIAAKITGQGG